jgi:hypothetical protein
MAPKRFPMCRIPEGWRAVRMRGTGEVKEVVKVFKVV